MEEILPVTERRSAITSQSIGVAELGALLLAVPTDSNQEAYRRAVVEENVLGIEKESGRRWRYATLRRLYLLRSDSVLFRALRELWAADPGALPLLAGSCAMARDVVFRATADLIIRTSPGDEISSVNFADSLATHFPGVYAPTTCRTVAAKAYSSWEQTGHLGAAAGGRKMRHRATCRPANMAYALMFGYLEGARGEALFETLWARVLDHPKSQLFDLAFAASQRGMLEYRHAGGVVEVGFRELLRPMEGQLL